jgi:probable F420-dependent oxidoreductase
MGRVKIRFAVSMGLGAPDPDQMAAVVTEAEGQGFDSLWFSDITLLPGTDPFLAVTFASTHSKRMKLGVNLVPFGYEPFVFARQVAQLDRLVNGRLLITLVPGLDRPGERAALGIAGRHRGRMMEALIPDLRTWWAGGQVAVGEDQEPIALPVLPHQEELEIWLGGQGPDAVQRAGRFSDGWLGSIVSPERAGAIREEIQAVAAETGRTIDPEHFGLSVGYAREAGDLDKMIRLRRPKGQDVTPVVPVGGAELRDMIQRLIDNGLSKFVVRRVAPVESWPSELAWLADTVLDLQT